MAFIKRNCKKILIILASLLIASIVLVFSVNLYVTGSTEEQIVTENDLKDVSDIDCIIVLGCHVKSEGVPGRMLTDRLDTGIALYKAGVAPKLLMSGDHGTVEYNEVGTMKKYAEEAGVPSEDIFMDHAGFSTYETVYRAKEIFCADKVIIVTQEYHMYRALHIANSLGVEAYGVCATEKEYAGQWYRDFREVLARVKDAGTSVIKPKPT
ncbi:MAG: YdcF family protein, partial [Clostridia bacterium]|nr:YdcF family protein [Clostridia bacterium]